MRNRMLTRLFAAICLLLLLSACQTGMPERKKATAPPDHKPAAAPLRVAYSGSQSMKTALDLVIDRYQQAYPGRPVERVEVAYGNQSFEASALAMAEMDIIPASSYVWPEQKLTDLHPYASTNSFDESVYGLLLGDREQMGSLYAVPFIVRPFVMACNTEAFAAAGIPLPDVGWTWDEFRGALAKLKEKHGRPVFEALYSDALVLSYIEQKTGRPIWEATERDVSDALLFFNTLLTQDGTMAPSPSTEKGFTLNYTSFAKGDILVSYQEFGSGISSHYAFAWKYMPIPSFSPDNRLTTSIVSWLGVAPQSKDPHAAWDLIQLATSDEIGTDLAALGIMPARMSDAVRDAAMDSAAAGTAIAALTKLTFTALPANTAKRQLARPVLTAGNRVMAGQATVDEALQKYRADLAAAAARKP